jgi:predicted transcriptional regulator
MVATPAAGSESGEARRSAPDETPLTRHAAAGNTTGMKAAVSIPDEVFEEGERLARRLQTSRSQLYARALAEFVVQHEEDKVTACMNRVLEDVGVEVEDFTRRAARRTLRHVEW